MFELKSKEGMMGELRKEFRRVALAPKVLVVASIHYTDSGELFDWTAYVDAVPGVSHSKEWELVAQNGAKISGKIAEILFPGLDISKYRW